MRLNTTPSADLRNTSGCRDFVGFDNPFHYMLIGIAILRLKCLSFLTNLVIVSPSIDLHIDLTLWSSTHQEQIEYPHYYLPLKLL